MRFNPKRSLLSTISIFLCLVTASGALGQSTSGRPELTLEDLTFERSVKAAHEASLLAIAGVYGVGIAERGGEAVILVFVDPKASLAALPTSLSGVTVVAETSGEAFFMNGGLGCANFPVGCHSEKVEYPVPMGVSTSSGAHYNAGTLGFKACDAVTGTLGYVSANHVAAGVPWPGNPYCYNGSPGLSQWHPGLFELNPNCSSDPKCDPGNPTEFTNPVGVLERIVPLVEPPLRNKVDAAFVASDDSLTSASILDVGVPSSIPGQPVLNGCVRKSGRTTGLTHGRIDVVDLTWTNVFDECFTEDPDFEELISVRPDSNCGQCADPPCSEFAIGGDSGSALVDDSDRVVGLVFAREAGGGAMVFAATAENVLGELGLTLDLDQCAANQPPVAVDDYFLTLWETPITIPWSTLLANDEDPDGDPLLVCDVGRPRYGTLSPELGGNTYTPPPGCLVGLDSYDYTVCDDYGGESTATAWITIAGIVCPASE